MLGVEIGKHKVQCVRFRQVAVVISASLFLFCQQVQECLQFVQFALYNAPAASTGRGDDGIVHIDAAVAKITSCSFAIKGVVIVSNALTGPNSGLFLSASFQRRTARRGHYIVALGICQVKVCPFFLFEPHHTC